MLSLLIPLLGNIFDRAFPDPAQAAAAKLEVMKMAQSGDLGQIDVNKVEAASSSVFVAGWRPFMGWVCGAAYAYKFVIAPIAIFTLTALGHPVNVPSLDVTEMSSVLLGMLGLGAMRSYDKKQGTS